MKYNLENIKKSEAIRDDGISYIDFRKTLTPYYHIVWKDIAQAYFLILFFVFLTLNSEKLLNNYIIYLSPILGLAIGLCIAHLRLFVHEAIHANIHPTKQQNDLMANIFLCSWFGIDLKQARKKHWIHHRSLGTPDDSENLYFNDLSLRLIIHHVSGIKFFNRIIQALSNIINTRETKVNFTSLTSALINLSLIVLFLHYGFFHTAFVWVLATQIFFPLFFEIRQILEHRDDWADPRIDYSKKEHGKTSRIFEGNFLSNFFGAAGFNRHLLHHWDPDISYTRFDEMEKFLMRSPKCWVSVYGSKTTYFDTFLFLFMF